MILTLAHLLVNLAFYATLAFGLYTVCLLPSRISFHILFWGPLSLVGLTILVRASHRVGRMAGKLRARIHFTKELAVAHTLSAIAFYVYSVAIEAAIKTPGWLEICEALKKGPEFHLYQTACSVSIILVAGLTGVFAGRLEPTQGGYYIHNIGALTYWLTTQTRIRLTRPQPVQRQAPLRGRSFLDYYELAEQLFKTKPQTLWNDILWRLFLLRRFLNRLAGGEHAALNSASTSSHSTEPKIQICGDIKASVGEEAPIQGQTRPLTPATEKVNLNEHFIYWAYLPISLAKAVGHFLIVGSSGSGKTVQLRLFLQSIATLFGKGLDQRILIYDGKREYIPIVQGINPRVPVHILDPFDARSIPWDIAADVVTPAIAQQIASVLVPKEESAQPFFADATRHLLEGVMTALIKHAPGRWTLRDVILIFRRRDRLERVLNLYQDTRDIKDTYFAEPKTLANVLTTAATKFAPLSTVAALWDNCRTENGEQIRGLSVASWLEGESILILGHHAVYSEAIGPINRAIFRLASDVLLSQSDSDHRKTWLLIDEAREAGRLDGLWSLCNQGRSKGIHTILGLQDIDGFETVYGPQHTKEITGQCQHKSILRTDSAPTARWAQEHFGDAINWETVFGASEQSGWNRGFSSGAGGGSHSSGTNGGRGTSTTQSPQQRPILLGSELMSFRPPSPETGFRAVHDVPSIGVFPTHISWDWVFSNLHPKVGKCTVDRNVAHQELRPWDLSDEKRLGLHEENTKKGSTAIAEQLLFGGEKQQTGKSQPSTRTPKAAGPDSTKN
jgi:hypothetical protein